jgi:mannose-1-phosphate guanylyltransferase/mannose-6-phosphate isomerase
MELIMSDSPQLLNNVLVGRPSAASVTRPWGSFRQCAHNGLCTVNLITVNPGQRLSLQFHDRRSELWIVLDERCEVQIGEVVEHPSSGAEFWIPARTPHRLSSRGPQVRILEVAFGDWQQDDITRYEDDYGRG